MVASLTSPKRAVRLALVALALMLASALSLHADQGGVSFWVPGQFGSFAAVSSEPGFSLTTTGYTYMGSTDASRAFPRGRRIVLGVDTTFNSVWFCPVYTAATPFLGGQFAFSVTGFYAYNLMSGRVQLQPSNLFVKRGDTLRNVGDLIPMAQVFWARGDHNWMAYVTANVPVGSYDPNRLAETGLGFWAADLGGAYTYYSEKSGREFSATLGATTNWENPDTEYKNGVELHLDLGASQSLSDVASVGLAGYWYQQLAGDSGAGARLGPFYSSTAALGAQASHTFTVGGTAVDVNLRAYYEVMAHRRPQGYTVFLNITIPLGGKKR